MTPQEYIIRKMYIQQLKVLKCFLVQWNFVATIDDIKYDFPNKSNKSVGGLLSSVSKKKYLTEFLLLKVGKDKGKQRWQLNEKFMSGNELRLLLKEMKI